ncbi:hypothetical protein HOU00_gp189 [Caulobacter phage CcrPW]|uniref:Uncharacterized protein n=1 Tax=Caulobacter phage CcrPW TaxID=2283271 RepID=A0A385EB37_9CAUD|nr:hypothetical protein HOU00_gp189 [Caulobacter phage CcrPW]AXQ68936.1 hypothetical protein CcrPW_gp397 [Caulobacter phage CcrPW]
MTKETRVGFMCMTDFDDELENAAGGNKVYPSMEDLKSNASCWDTCGVVRVTVVREEVVVPQNLFPQRSAP